VLKAGGGASHRIGASAIADRRGRIIRALEAIGDGCAFGMPVNTGISDARRRSRRPVLGAPAAPHSKENGFDWILMRLLPG